MFEKRVYNEYGELQCVRCGEFKTLDEFYPNRVKCVRCYNDIGNEYHRNDVKSRVRAAYRSQLSRAGILTFEDDLTEKDVREMLNEQGFCCAACGKQFLQLSDCEFGHVVSVANGGHLTRSNIQLVCKKHNPGGKLGTKNIAYMRMNISLGNFKFDWNN